MKIAILTNEYPPNVYGGAGVHVEYLTKELAKADGGRHSIKVLCFGSQNYKKGNLTVKGIGASHKFSAKDPKHNKFLDTVFRDVAMSGELDGADVVHCHTWYSHFAGLLAKQLLQAPLVLTTHSLEPHRPWKVEQLGTAYYGSSWIEKTAYENADGVVAVSGSMKEDVQNLYGVDPKRVKVIHNGIDLDEFKPTPDKRILEKYHIDKNIPFILFVGRITRQKGIIHLVNAIKYLAPGNQVVLCAGSPDTKEIGLEMAKKIEEAKKTSKNKIIWVSEMVPKKDLIALYSQASVFVCPSVYEPFGIINLEAMACETPVVASAVGGIPEVVVNGKTGILVPLKHKSALNAEPADPRKFAFDLAQAVNSIMASPAKNRRMAVASRKRVVEHFSWKSIAAKTLDFYKELIEK
jgi:glycogen synthase